MVVPANVSCALLWLKIENGMHNRHIVVRYKQKVEGFKTLHFFSITR